MTRTVLSPTTERLERIPRKIVKVEEEIAEAQGNLPPEPGLFGK
jgi:hypothetical protein